MALSQQFKLKEYTMSAYAILKETSIRGTNRYKVILRSDDGYTEAHEYVGNVTTLENAARTFNTTRIESLTVPTRDPDPVFVEVI